MTWFGHCCDRQNGSETAHLGILGFCATRLDTGNPETRRHGNPENTRQGRRQEWQVPKLSSPASFSGNHFHFTVSCTAYQAYPCSFAGVFCSRQFITKFLIFVPSIHHEVLDHAELMLHIAESVFLLVFCSQNFSLSFQTFAQILFPLFASWFLQVYVLLFLATSLSSLTPVRYRAGRIRY